MLTDEEFDNLLTLARLDVPEDEVASLKKDIENILVYVEQIQEVSADIDITPTAGVLRNVMREDTDPYESGIFKKDLLDQAPATDKNKDYIKVKKIL